MHYHIVLYSFFFKYGFGIVQYFMFPFENSNVAPIEYKFYSPVSSLHSQTYPRIFLPPSDYGINQSPINVDTSSLLQNTHSDQLSPRFGNLFLKPFAFSNVPVEPPPKKKTDPELCTALGGTLVGKECLQFFKDPLSFANARAMCMTRGGDLYVPENTEGFFFAKYFLYFREAFDRLAATPKVPVATLGWIGAQREGAAFPIVTVDGTDVTWEPIYNIEEIEGGHCVHIKIRGHLAGDDCSAEKPYTCEYPLKQEEPKIVAQPVKHYSFFNKFAHYYK